MMIVPPPLSDFLSRSLHEGELRRRQSWQRPDFRCCGRRLGIEVELESAAQPSQSGAKDLSHQIMNCIHCLIDDVYDPSFAWKGEILTVLI